MESRHDDRPGPGVVVVGTGFGCLTHVRALRAAGFESWPSWVGIRERTARRAARWEVPVAHTSLDRALDMAGVDAVTIATPPATHAPLVHQVVGAGKHVLCEKPFALDTASAREMLAAAESAGVVHLLGTEFRWATGQALAARAIASGAIGQPRFALLILEIPLLADAQAEVPDWWHDRALGGGWLGAHAAHGIDQVRHTLGEFAGVSARLSNVTVRDWTAEDSYLVHFRLRNGVDGVLQSSAADRGPLVMMTRFVGTDGTLWLEGDRVKVADGHGTRTLEVPPDLVHPAAEPPPADLLVTAYELLHATGIDLGPYTALARQFRRLIEGHPASADPRPATFADGVAVCEVLDAVRHADRSGVWEEIGP